MTVEIASTETNATVDAGQNVEVANESKITQDSSQVGEPSKAGENSKESNSTEQEILDYKNDPRWGKFWKTENDLYKGYREIEKLQKSKYDPIIKQHEGLINQLKENGFSLEQISEVLTEYKSFKDPENPLIANGNYVNKWLGNPLYENAVANFFKDLENKELQRKYPNMTEEQIQKQIVLESRLEALENEKKQQDYSKQVDVYSNNIDEGLKKAESYAKSKGLEFSDDIRKNLLEYCDKNEILPKFVFHAFLDLYHEQLEKASAELYEKKTLEKTSKIKNAGILNGNNDSLKPVSNKVDTFDSLKDSIRNGLKKMGFPD